MKPIDMFTGDAAALMARRSMSWARTSTRQSGLKVICPECGRAGLAGGAWTATCISHVKCELCDKVMVLRGLIRHLVRYHDMPRRTSADRPGSYPPDSFAWARRVEPTANETSSHT